jgi:hypothetical protein
MARNLYSAYRSAGTSSGQYKASLFDVESKSDKMAFADKRGAWEQEKLSRRVETIGAGLELASTIAGGLQDKQKFEGKLKAVGTEYGDLQPDKRSFGQKLFGAEREYTFGEGKDARTFSKAGVGVQGGRLLGESMLDEAGIGFTPSGTSEETGSKKGGSTSEISEYIKRPETPETLDVAVDSDKNLLESVPEYRQGKGLTAQANEKLYESDPSMKGKSAAERVSKYEELFPGNNIDFESITNPLGF